MTDIKPQSEPSLSDIKISVRHGGGPMTPQALKDIAKMIKFVEEMEHIRKTYCPRCRDQAARDLQAQYGVEPYEDE